MTTDAHDSESEAGFPLSIDLSPYVGAPARCRVWVRSARKVRWLANRVRRVAGLRGPLLLMAGECLLPPGEPLRVIQPDDTLSVAHVEHKWQQPFSFHEDEDDPLTESATVESTSPVKLTTLESTPLVKPSQPARHKHVTKESAANEEPSVRPATKRQHIHTPTMEQTLEEPVVDYEALDQVKRRALALLQQVSKEAIDEDVVDAPKKKRRRVRRRRPCKDVQLDLSVEIPESGSIQNGSELSNNKNNQDTLDVMEETGAVLNGSASPLSQTPATLSLSQTPCSVVQVSTHSVHAVQSPTILTYPPPTALVRNQTTPRAPRVVRALTEPLPMEAALVSTS